MENRFKRAISLVMTLLMIFSTVACISGVSLAADTVTENEPNDGSNKATLIPVDTLCNGALSDGDDVDWYKFTTDADYFNFEFVIDPELVNSEDIKSGWNVKIYASDGVTQIKDYNIWGNFTTPNLSFDGTLYIRIQAKNNYYLYAPIDCVYGIKVNTTVDEFWEGEDNNSSSRANSINTDATYHGSLYKGEDIDWYKVTNKKDYFTLSFKLNEAVDFDLVESGWNIYIYLADGVTCIKKYTGVTKNFTTTELPFSGDFLIKIVAANSYYLYSPTDCYYDFSINTYSSSIWESEINDTSSTADPVKINTVYNGALYHSEDIDWFVFDTTTGAFNIELAPDENVDTSLLESGWTLSVYPYGSSNAIYTKSGITANFKTMDLPFKGKYVVSVKATNNYYLYAPTDCTYKLKITQHSQSELWEKETNNTAESATKIDLNKKYNANFHYKEDQDFYTFTATNNGCYDLMFTRGISDSIGSGWVVKVTGLKSGEIYKGALGVDTDTVTIKLSKVVKGEKYTVRFYANNSYYSPVAVNYSLKISAKTHSYTSKVTQAATYKSTGVKTYTCKNCGYTYSETIARKTLNAVSGLKATPSATSIKFSWAKVSGAEKYEVYYSTNGKSWKKVTATKNSITIKKLKSGTAYKVKVRAVAGKNNGAYSSVISTATKPATVTISKLTAGSKALTATWKTVSGATGYEVQYSTSKNFTKKTTKTATIKKAKTKKTTIKKLKKGKKYFVKVRAYKTVSGKKICGAWSSVKSVKVK